MVSLSILEDASEDILQDLAIIKGTNHWIKFVILYLLLFCYILFGTFNKRAKYNL